MLPGIGTRHEVLKEMDGYRRDLDHISGQTDGVELVSHSTREEWRMRKTRAVCATLPMGLILLGAVAGCNSANRNVARDQSSAASAESTDTGAPGASGGAPAATPQGGLTDANIVALLDAANKADSSAGALAAKKGTRTDVKNFARLMMSEHHALRAQGQQLAKQLGVTPKPPEHDPLAPYAANEMKALQSTAKGAEFDRTYIDNEVSVHQAVLDLANQARVTTQTAQLRDLIEKAIPVIRKHLDQAMAIQKQLSPSA
jgi:putative membrane protein